VNKKGPVRPGAALIYPSILHLVFATFKTLYFRALPGCRACPEKEIRLRIAEQRVKAFLLEVPVIGERFGQPFVPHGLHRNTIDQAVKTYRQKLFSRVSFGPAVDVVIVLAGSIFRHLGHNFGRNLAHVVTDNFGDVAVGTGSGINILYKDLACVFFRRDAKRPRLGGERGLLFVGKMNRQRHHVVAVAFIVSSQSYASRNSLSRPGTVATRRRKRREVALIVDKV
jgi:hypothetical protein